MSANSRFSEAFVCLEVCCVSAFGCGFKVPVVVAKKCERLGTACCAVPARCAHAEAVFLSPVNARPDRIAF